MRIFFISASLSKNHRRHSPSLQISDRSADGQAAAWSIEQSMSLMDAMEIAASVLSLPDSAESRDGTGACQLASESMSNWPTRLKTSHALRSDGDVPALARQTSAARNGVRTRYVKLTASRPRQASNDIYRGDTVTTHGLRK